MSSSQLTFIFFRRGRVQPPTSHVSHVVSLGGTSHARWALPVKSWSKNKCVGELNGTRAKSVVASVLVKIRRPMINGVTTKGKSTPETIDCNFSLPDCFETSFTCQQDPSSGLRSPGRSCSTSELMKCLLGFTLFTEHDFLYSFFKKFVYQWFKIIVDFTIMVCIMSG